jgi:hypothetical protein
LDSQEWSDINIVTGCLKLYLRELPDPLIPFRLYKPFIDSASECIFTVVCVVKQFYALKISSGLRDKNNSKWSPAGTAVA